MRDPRFPELEPAATRRSESVRLEKALADAGVASRRDGELAIHAGRVRVNGRTVRVLPYRVDPAHDLIEFDGEVVDSARRGPGRARGRIYLMLHKPRGVISTARDPGGRPNVVAMVEHAVPAGERVYPVGRLDADSTGLVLLTNDGELAHRLAHPRHGAAKEYRVAVQGALPQEALDRLRRGLFLAERDSPTGGAKRARLEHLRVLRRARNRRQGDLALVAITLHEGQNREIRRLFARVGAKVRSLERVAIGPLKLGALRTGQFRLLRPEEVLALRRSVHLG
ncbi:MAG: pseudouridine synthase [Gammaproteobacteria bacterium]